MTGDLPAGVRLESRPCPFGCERDDESVVTGHDRQHGIPGQFTVVRCRSCGLLRTDPRPTPDSIGVYYPNDYGPYLSSRVAERETEERSGAGQTRRPRLFSFNTNPIPPMRPGRMLEIGCASGAFLHRMASDGWEVEGIESSVAAARSARRLGYRVHAGAVETAPPPDRPVDLVVGFMVLEHLHDPVGVLARLRTWTRPGGWIVLSVPNAGALEFRIFRNAWYALMLPLHLYHYTPRTLTALLRHTGWEVQRLVHQRVLSNLFASLGYRLHDATGDGRLARTLMEFPTLADRWRLHHLLYPFAAGLAALGQTGRMTIWGRRR